MWKKLSDEDMCKNVAPGLHGIEHVYFIFFWYKFEIIDLEEEISFYKFNSIWLLQP